MNAKEREVMIAIFAKLPKYDRTYLIRFAQERFRKHQDRVSDVKKGGAA